MSLKLSVIVPAFNEKDTMGKIIRVIRSVPVDKEIIIVDDGSTDGTRQILQAQPSSPDLRILYHPANRGKGAAVRTGIREASGDAIIIQDADLEYEPMDYLALLKEMERSGANVVFGSRFLGKKNVSSLWHRSVNRFLTALTNVLFGSRLTDMETCYKLFRAPFLRSVELRSDGFEIEVELTVKTLRRGEKITEVPVAYKGRTFHEGKKIGWKDGVKAVWRLLQYRFSRG